MKETTSEIRPSLAVPVKPPSKVILKQVLLSRVLKVQEEQPGNESLTVINTEEYLADTYTALGRYADASNYYVHVASILKKCFPGYADRLETVMKKMRMEGAV